MLEPFILDDDDDGDEDDSNREEEDDNDEVDAAVDDVDAKFMQLIFKFSCSVDDGLFIFLLILLFDITLLFELISIVPIKVFVQ